MVDLCHPLGWQSGWQVCAPYIPSHSPLAARLPPNQKILQDIMRYAPKVDRWLLRSAETSSPPFPSPLFLPLLFNPPSTVHECDFSVERFPWSSFIVLNSLAPPKSFSTSCPLVNVHES